jgi:hypothetical protein
MRGVGREEDLEFDMSAVLRDGSGSSWQAEICGSEVHLDHRCSVQEDRTTDIRGTRKSKMKDLII